MEILFEHLFREIILQRGYAYYIDQQVSEPTVAGKTISASVRGSETYQVEIELNDEGIEYMSCDCSYFEGGDNCKHLAAVFYSLQNSESEQSKAWGVKSELDVVGELLASLTYDELFTFLQEELRSNSALRFKFKAAFQHRDKTPREISSYLQHIDSVFELHLGRRGFIEYSKAIDFEFAVGELLSSVRRLIENEQYETSFIILKHLVGKLSGLGIDDSLGTTTSIMNEVVELLALIITEHSEPAYSMLFEWLCANLDGAIDDHLGDSLIDLFMNYYHEEAKLQKKIPIIDRIIAWYDKPKQESSFGSFQLAKWLKNRISILMQLGEKEKASRLIQEYLHVSEIRDIAITQHTERGEYQRAIALLREGKKVCRQFRGIVDKYSKQLIELYKVIGDKEQLLAETRTRLIEYSPGKLEAYREYKGLFSPAEWVKEREYILERLRAARCDMKVYYAEENLLSKLLAEIESSQELSGLDTYEELLCDSFSEEVRDLLVARVKKKWRNIPVAAVTIGILTLSSSVFKGILGESELLMS